MSKSRGWSSVSGIGVFMKVPYSVLALFLASEYITGRYYM